MGSPAGSRRLFARLLESLNRSVERRPASLRAARHALDRCKALLSERGEVSGARLSADVQRAYKALDNAGIDIFFHLLLDTFSPDPIELQAAADAYRADPSQAALLRLRGAVESPIQELFRLVNLAPGGTAVLLDMRRHLVRALKDHPELAPLDADLVHLFRSWFNRGFLVLQRIDWRTSALVLERLIDYEAVHQIQDWRDLRRRLENDRRCYAFFHPALPDEPLIFIEVALRRDMDGRVQPLLDVKAPVVDPATATCAIFYSITNCQEGLRGISFGNFLIKQVVEDLGREFAGLRTFATLSPLPGFTQWLAGEGRERCSPQLGALVGEIAGKTGTGPLTVPPPQLKDELVSLGAFYLLHAKDGEAPLDPVARFHLANGARLQRVNWMGDTSDTGLRRSLGLMANYVYRLDDLERNHEAYAKLHKVVASREFERLVRRLALRPPIRQR